jgi:signal transduction histidine kinase
MTTFGLVSYFGLKNATLKIGKERLHSLSEQLGSMLMQSTQELITNSHTTADHPSIKKILQTRGKDSSVEAVELLQRLQQDTAAILIDLVDTERRVIFRVEKNNLKHTPNFDSLLTLLNLPDTGKIGRIIRIKDSIYYPLSVGIVDNGKIIGYLVRWRLLWNTPQSVEQLSQLMGTRARVYFGNTDHSVWTDMIKPVPNPLPPGSLVESDKLIEYKDSNGNKFLAVVNPVKNTSWVLLVEFSKTSVLQTATRFLNWLIIAGVILVTLGIFIAWLMSRSITRPLNELTAATSAIASGNYSSSIPVDRLDEVGKLARAFNAMGWQVNQAKRALEQKVLESGKMNEQLRNLSAHLQNIREDERKHIAREMHDELGQFLTALKMDLLWLNKKLSTGEETDANREKLKEMTRLVDEAVLFVRKLAAELRPSILDDLGLIPALEWHSQEFTRRFQINVEFKSRVEEIETSPMIATGIFRIYQESLTNVARHSEAKKVMSVLEIIGGEIRLSIADDGKGFDMNGSGRTKTLGLLGMKERALMLGGTLEIISEPGKGTTIYISVPLNQPVAATVTKDPGSL